MGFLIVLIVVALVLGASMWAFVGVVGLLMTLVVAGIVGWAADLVVPGKLPYGALGAVLAGVVGGLIGNLLFSLLRMPGFGPSLAGVELIPAFVGALIVAGALELVTARRSPA